MQDVRIKVPHVDRMPRLVREKVLFGGFRALSGGGLWGRGGRQGIDDRMSWIGWKGIGLIVMFRVSDGSSGS